MSRNLFTGIALALAIIAAPVCSWGTPAEIEPEPLPLWSGWQYRWGDSPMDPSGTYAWLLDRSDEGWVLLRKLDWPTGRDGREWMWYRIRLPNVTWAHPTLYLPNILISFQVFLEEKLIYEYGIFEPDDRNKYSMVETHLVPLPRDYHGKLLSIRVYSNVFAMGIEGMSEPLMLGAQTDIVRAIIFGSADTSVVGFLFVFVGLFAVLTCFVRFRANVIVPLSFAAFALLLGIFYILSDEAAEFAIRSNPVKLYAMAIAYGFFPVGMFAYLQATIFRRAGVWTRRVVWSLFAAHLGCAIAVLGLDLLRVAPLPVGMRAFNVLFAVSIPGFLVVLLRQVLRGSLEARIVAWGFAAFAVTGFLDVLQGLHKIPYWYWLSQWGAVVFVACLGYVLERQFLESHRRLKTYSAELEEKSEQLEEYSRTLEDKVTERTRDLDDKNRQLESTLQELKDTQQQLVIREKMASLGNLVAGVAHEVNNPIGAVISASDVSSRCLGVVRDFVDEKAEGEGSRVRKASALLAENNRVISDAAQRVSRIVKSLKNFSRLDEAEFQRADIHDGIDSTLTLVRHLVKDRIDVLKEYGHVPKLWVYPNQLNQVFMNLIVNAIDAIEGKGTITIKTHKDSLNAYISVADTGKGIPAANIRRIFDPGFTTKGVGVGTGLGLSISYNIIQKHGGALDVESTPGRGSTFTIVLPLKQVKGETPGH